MASIQDQISAARKEGYSNAEIRQFLGQSPQYQQATGAGYSSEEVWNHLGLNDQLTTGVQLGGVDIGREAALAGSNAAAGAATTLGIPGDLESMARQYIPGVQGLEDAAGRALGDSPGGQFFPTSEELTHSTNQLGATNRPDLAPQNFAEDKLSAISQGVGSALPIAMVAPQAAGSIIASGAGGGLGANLGAELTPGSPVGPFLGSIIGGIAPAGAEDVLQSVLHAFSDPAGAAESAAQRAMELKASKADSIGEIQSGAQARAAGISSMLGSAPYYQGAGQAIQQEAREWLTGTSEAHLGGPGSWLPGSMPAQLEEAYAPLKSAIAASPERDMLQTMYGKGNFREALQGADPTLVPLYDQAVAKSTELTNLAQTTVGKIIKSPLDDTAETILPENMARALITDPTAKGATLLNRVRQIAPNGVDQLASSFLNPMENEPGGVAAWGKLPGNVKEALVPDAAHRAELDSAWAEHAGAPGKVNQKISFAQATASGLRKLAGNPLTTPLTMIAGLETGKDVVTPMLHALAVPGADVIGPLAGVGVPLALRGVKPAVAMSPSAATGFVGGLNELMGGTEQ